MHYSIWAWQFKKMWGFFPKTALIGPLLILLATLQLRAVTVPLYAASSVEQAAYIINDADIRILLLVTKKGI